jgi:hypothetical protein
MLHEDFIRVGIRALLDDDQELLDAIERHYEARVRHYMVDLAGSENGIGLLDLVGGTSSCSTFWTHAITWLRDEVCEAEAERAS